MTQALASRYSDILKKLEAKEKYLELAGRKYGLLGYAPEYGRFDLIEFKALPEKEG